METLVERAYAVIRADLIGGKFQPGSKLTFRNLQEEYGMGASPIREALARLTSDRLVEFTPQRGYSVAPISMEDLLDLCNLRIDLCNKALRASIEKGGEEWESEIVVATHQLKRSQSTTSFDEWEPRHRRFHTSLIAACGSPWLIHFCETLADQFRRYRRLIVTHRAESKERWSAVIAEHLAISDAVLRRDKTIAVTLLTNHFKSSFSQVTSLYAEQFHPETAEKGTRPKRRRKPDSSGK